MPLFCRDLTDIGCHINVIDGCQQIDRATKLFGLGDSAKYGVVFSTYSTLVSSVQSGEYSYVMLCIVMLCCVILDCYDVIRGLFCEMRCILIMVTTAVHQRFLSQRIHISTVC